MGIEGFGIPITAEWLVKLGFVKSAEDYYFQQHVWVNTKGFRIAVDDEDFTLNIPHNDCGYYTRLQYVHQLQNLYFALTGEELQFNI